MKKLVIASILSAISLGVTAGEWVRMDGYYGYNENGQVDNSLAMIGCMNSLTYVSFVASENIGNNGKIGKFGAMVDGKNLGEFTSMRYMMMHIVFTDIGEGTVLRDAMKAGNKITVIGDGMLYKEATLNGFTKAYNDVDLKCSK